VQYYHSCKRTARRSKLVVVARTMYLHRHLAPVALTGGTQQVTDMRRRGLASAETLPPASANSTDLRREWARARPESPVLRTLSLATLLLLVLERRKKVAPLRGGGPAAGAKNKQEPARTQHPMPT
jgi:hypothetical protein